MGQCNSYQHIYRPLVPLCHDSTGHVVLLHPAVLQRSIKVSEGHNSAKDYYNSVTAFSSALQKLESQTWEPIIANFAETLKGLNTIRAFNQESVFMDRFFNKLEANNITFVMINAANRFLGVVLVG